MINKYMIFTLIILLISVELKSQFFYSASASVNLIGDDINSNTSPVGTISSTYQGDCSGGMSSVSDNIRLSVSSNSSECPAVNHGGAIAKWKNTNSRLIGNNNVTVPITLNFELTGGINLSTSPGAQCFNSIAQGVMSYYVIVINNGILFEKNGFTSIQHNNGFQSFYTSNGFESMDGFVTVTPKISVENDVIRIVEDIEEIHNLYQDLTEAEQNSDSLNISESFWDLLRDGTDLLSWELNSDTLSTYEGNFINVINYIGYASSIGLPAGSALNIGFDVMFNYDFVTPVELMTDGDDVTIDIQILVNSETIPICSPSSQCDFSNTFKLESVTIPSNFQNENINLDSLKFELVEGVEIPVTQEIITSVTRYPYEKEFDISIFPNPVKSEISIFSHTAISLEKIVLSDLNGRIVEEKHINDSVNSIQYVFPKSISRGVYIISLFLPNGIVSERILKL